jgi:hypothetical protein
MSDTVNESKQETFEVFKKIDIGNIVEDIVYLGKITGTLSEVKEQIRIRHGEILSLDESKKEIVMKMIPTSIRKECV